MIASDRIAASIMKLMPNNLKGLFMALHIMFTSGMFLKSRKISSILNPFIGGGREIFYGTALFPEERFYVADVGAYRGYCTVLASKIVGSRGHVYSFELEPNNFQILNKVILLNRLKNVTPLKLAISDKDVFESLYLSDYPSMHSTVLKRSNKIIKVSALRLDSLVRPGVIRRLDLVKIDVEGAELKVLQGCKNIIREFNPIFSIDVNHYKKEFEDVQAFFDYFDYKIHSLIGGIDRPYSIVAYPPHKAELARRLIVKTRYLSSGMSFFKR